MDIHGYPITPIHKTDIHGEDTLLPGGPVTPIPVAQSVHLKGNLQYLVFKKRTH